MTGFPDFGLTNESGRARRRGFEFEWAAQRGPWELRGSYAYVRTREEFVSIDTSDPSGPRSSSYHREVRRPRHQGSLRIHWAGERLDLSGGVRVQGSMSDFNFSRGFDGISNRQTLGGFALVDARASYRIHEQLELFARVENALDKDYEEIVGFDAPGFGAFGGLRWRWRRK